MIIVMINSTIKIEGEEEKEKAGKYKQKNIFFKKFLETFAKGTPQPPHPRNHIRIQQKICMIKNTGRMRKDRRRGML